MSSNDPIDVVVNEDGTLQFIYHDALADLIPVGYTCPIQRASRVEPADNGRWTADMTPAIDLMTPAQYEAWAASLPEGMSPQDYNSAQLEGENGEGYATRAEALAAEVAWLKRYAGV